MPRRRPAPRSNPAPALALMAALVLSLPLVLSGCSGDSARAGERDEDTLTVLAAASLTEVFATLGEAFEDQHPGVQVETSLGSSTDLAEQVADGAPGDVLATADAASMEVAQDAGVVTDPVAFATNTLVLVVPADNPADIASLDDLEGSTWVRCADEVPCGRVALAVLADQGVTAEPVSLEEDVKAALEKVTSGEADAALVYASDAVAAGDAVTAIEVPSAGTEPTSYLLGVLDQAASPGLAAEWRALVLSAEGRAALEDAGFTLP